jgi:hypothetical protein
MIGEIVSRWTKEKEDKSVIGASTPTSRRKEYGLKRVYHRLTIIVVASLIKLSVLTTPAPGTGHIKEKR